MVDIINPKCKFEKCKKRPYFNFEGTKRELCSEHKKEGMINVLSRRCRFDNCKITPTFNFEGNSKAEFCS